ncbi:MAG: 30S ribosomal protein S20 [Bacteroidia bacterium]|nr:30S ribosomal protein S20 [Bacteroidia bacterium]MDW8015606.1 30S ribosomal protein S20 [Bacteroidia bacterium]
MAAPTTKKKKTARSRSALRRQRKILRRRARNLEWKAKYRVALRALKKESDPTRLPELLRAVHSLLDRLAQRNIFHRNKAARLKSRLARQVAQRLAGAPPA